MTTFPNVACVGMHFRGSAAVALSKTDLDGVQPRLEREPDNEFDAFAIKVWIEDLFFAYIERGQAAWIAPLMDEGQTAVATFSGTEQRGKNTYPLLTIEVSPPATPDVSA